jgi:MFS family permease
MLCQCVRQRESPELNAARWRNKIGHSLPFYYGWVIVASTVSVSLSTRTVMAVATLSVFVVPMTQELGWSRGLFSGAVSLGGLCAVFISPLVGKWLDRYGSGLLLTVASVLTGALAIGLSFVGNPAAFYALYVPGRLIFSGPLELGIPTAISNWFIRRRPLGLAADAVAKGAGLTMIPLLAQFIITGWDWRTAWITLGVLTFALGVIPPVLFMARRPEDMGLEPDPAPNEPAESVSAVTESGLISPAVVTEPSYTESSFTVRQAFHTRAFWLLAAFTALAFMVQAGVSLHQVAHYINQGLPGPSAALTASTFAFSQIFSAMFWAALGRRFPVRFLLSAAAFVVAAAAFGTSLSESLPTALIAAATVGLGVGGLHLLVRLAWADYYGREHLGTIRGYAMSAQIGGQAVGPVLAGFLFDATGSYEMALMVFTGAGLLAGVLALFATPPKLLELTPEPATV